MYENDIRISDTLNGDIFLRGRKESKKKKNQLVKIVNSIINKFGLKPILNKIKSKGNTIDIYIESLLEKSKIQSLTTSGPGVGILPESCP